MAKQKINQIQLDNNVYAYGTIGTENGGGTKSMSQWASNGLTFNGSNQYTVVTPGLYRLYAQQLIQTNGSTAIYFGWSINGVMLVHGYIVPSRQDDAIASHYTLLAAGDIIRISQTNASAASWGAVHSSYYIVLDKRTG